jgi:D-alanyl-D-alanine carboxypeptidase
MSSALLSFLASLLVSLPTPSSLQERALVQTYALLPPEINLSSFQHNQQQAPRRVRQTRGPLLTAQAALVVDEKSGQILWAQQPTVPRPLASLTKLATALTWRQGREEGKIKWIKVTPRAVRAAGASAHLRAGASYRADDLLAAMLVASANDAAEALARAYPGGKEKMLAQMSKLARSLHLRLTNFTSVTGLDDERNFGTAADMAVLFRAALLDQKLARFLQAEKWRFAARGGRSHIVRSTNKLLSHPLVTHGKTGYTQEAGENLVVRAEHDGHAVIAVVMGSKQRFADMQALLAWVFWAYRWGE